MGGVKSSGCRLQPKKSGTRRNWVETFGKLDARLGRKSNGVLSGANTRRQNVRPWDQEKQKNQDVEETVCKHRSNSMPDPPDLRRL
jgi:hypothetical protein